MSLTDQCRCLKRQGWCLNLELLSLKHVGLNLEREGRLPNFEFPQVEWQGRQLKQQGRYLKRREWYLSGQSPCLKRFGRYLNRRGRYLKLQGRELNRRLRQFYGVSLYQAIELSSRLVQDCGSGNRLLSRPHFVENEGGVVGRRDQANKLAQFKP